MKGQRDHVLAERVGAASEPSAQPFQLLDAASDALVGSR